MFSEEFINKVNEDPILFLLDIDVNILIKFIKYANEKYHNGESIISDETFDICIDVIKDIDPTNKLLKQIGAKTILKNKITLPYTMFSMNKIKSIDITIIDKWKTKFNGPYICSDKLDGISALLINKNNKLSLYTRGDGYIGSDISYLIDYLPTINKINTSKLLDNISIRGELIISKENFKKYPDMANARNMVSGIVNAKKINPAILLDIEFITYELINPWFNSQLEQFKILSEYGFKVVNFIENINIDFNNLSLILIDRKKYSDYELDGIIISNNILPIRTINSNPEYAFAYKDTTLLESADVEVINVEWNISKDGYIKPKLKLKPVKLSGVIISNVTAYNAKYIVDNVLGPGAIITLIRSGDVIPKIVKIIKPASNNKPQLPNLNYNWNETNVDIIISNDSLEQTIKELTFFFKKLNILNIDSAIVSKMIKVGIDSIDKIITIEKTDLEQVEGFKEKMIDKIYNNIQSRMNTLTLLDLMIASNTFGHGLGERKLTKITEYYPDIIKLYSDFLEDEIIEKIKNIDGFDTKTAEYFTKGLDIFFELFNKLKPDMRKQLKQSIIITQEKVNIIKNNQFINKVFVFSGFRNKEWEQIIINNGGKIGSTISSNTTILITNELDNTSSKVLKATKLNIQIITKNEFESIYMTSICPIV